MLSRPSLLCLVLLVGATTVPPACAQNAVYLRGFEVTPQHIVFGSIDSLRGDSAVINLGYAHGMQTGVSLVAVRTVQDQLIPVSGLTVLSTEADHARARVEGPFRVQVGDFILVHARRLKLFGGETRFNRLAKERFVRRHTGNGYSTLDASPELLDEVARDDSFRQRQHVRYEQPKFIARAAEKTGVLESRLGAVIPLPAVDPTRPDAREEAIRESDSTVLGFRMFLEEARTPNVLIARLSTDRLQSLPLLTGGGVIEESRAPLFRQMLLTWTEQAIASP